MTLLNNGDVLDNIEYDCYINIDSPDIEHYMSGEGDEETRAIIMTVLDIHGDPSHSAYDLGSLNTLIESLTLARESLISSDCQESN